MLSQVIKILKSISVTNGFIRWVVSTYINQNNQFTGLLNGELSSWINNNIESKFNWAIGYAAFSVSESNIYRVVKYILNQEEHHKNISFTEEYDEFLRAYHVGGL